MITKDIKYVGVNDKAIDLFEGQYYVPNGMSYNSYIIHDDKIAVMDSVDAKFLDEWLENVKKELDGKTPDYLIVHHMEPDHSANIHEFLNAYPTATVVATDKAFQMMNKFFATDFSERRLVVKDGDTLILGRHELSFYTTPMVHWPEVMMTYDSYDKVLFSADAFGKFGALDTDEDWACEARRYYFGIVGKYGVQVQNALKKLSELEIKIICPLHGPVLNENLGYYLHLYNIWSSYEPETDGVAIFYTSVYGNTKKAVELLTCELEKCGVSKISVTDLARCDMAEAIEDAFRYGKIILATTTYNNDIFPFMQTFINGLVERGYKKRKIGIIENGSWAPSVAKTIRKMLDEGKELTFADETVTIHSSLNEESTLQIKRLAREFS